MKGRLIAFCACLGLATAVSGSGRDRLPNRETREIRDGMELVGAECQVTIDAVEGALVVRGGAGRRIDFVARETVRSRDAAAGERARREVRLEVVKAAGGLELIVEGPFRCDAERRRAGERWCGSDHDPGYRVSYDIEISLPEHCAVDASTVNDDVSAIYRSRPQGRVSLRTINGDVELVAPDLAADVELKTMNGEMWSEFPFTQGASLPPVQVWEDGRRVIRFDGAATVRVGGGGRGERHRLETLNGSVYLRRTPVRPATRKEAGS